MSLLNTENRVFYCCITLQRHLHQVSLWRILHVTFRSTDKESVESELDIQDRFSCSTPSSLHSPGKACTSVGNGCTSGSILQIGTEHDANGETNSCESQENSSSISPDSLVCLS